MSSIHLKITQSWINFTKKGEYHHPHAHPNSLISGVFYVEADKDKAESNKADIKTKDVILAAALDG